MKMKSILVAGLALFLGAMTSCNKSSDELNKNEVVGNTHAAITLSFGEADLRAYEDDDKNHFNPKGEWEGNDLIKRVDVYLVDDQKVSSGQYVIGDFDIKVAPGEETKLVPKKAIKTTAGVKKVYVLINAPAKMRTPLSVTSKAEFEAAWKAVYVAHNADATEANYHAVSSAAMKELFDQEDVSGDKKDVIMMSNAKAVEIDVKPNVTKDEALATNQPKNRAIVPVKRGAARVVVTTKEARYDITDKSTGKVIGTVTDITYAVAQGENRMYIQQLIEGAPGSQIIKTPAYDIITNPFVKPQSYKDMNDNYDYSDLFVKNRETSVHTNGVATAEEIGKLAKPAFMLEANHERHNVGNTPATYDGKFFRGNTPYVLIRTKFIPTQEGLAENNQLVEIQDGTFFVGTTTGKIYTKVEHVTDPAKGGLKDQKFHKYEKGKVLYYAYVNPDIKERPKTLDAPVFRNNIYHVHIKSIQALGFNWNPLYPEDPDNPGQKPNYPVNPDPRPSDDGEDPVPPVKPEDPLGDKDIYMSVEVKVLKWNVHSYEVDLGL